MFMLLTLLLPLLNIALLFNSKQLDFLYLGSCLSPIHCLFSSTNGAYELLFIWDDNFCISTVTPGPCKKHLISYTLGWTFVSNVYDIFFFSNSNNNYNYSVTSYQ